MIPRASFVLLISLSLFPTEAVEIFPGTRALLWEGELDVRMMDGAHRFVERKILESAQQRERFWNRDSSSPEGYGESIDANRLRFRTLLGVVDQRLPAAMERFGDPEDAGLVAETALYSIYQVRWAVLEHISGEGLLLEPRGKPAACIVFLPDADQTPEQAAGLATGLEAPEQLARRLAEKGFAVLVPVLIDRDQHVSKVPWRDRSERTNREWIYRQAFQMGRHVIGYEIQKVLAAAEWFRQQYGQDIRVGVAGYGEGGLIAFYSAAADPGIDAALISGYFAPREKVWSEPIYRNVFGLLREFGDAEVAGLIVPRPLILEYSQVPAVPPDKGELETPPFEAVREEFERISHLVPRQFGHRRLVRGRNVSSAVRPGSAEALSEFAAALGQAAPAEEWGELRPAGVDLRRAFDPAARQSRQVKGLEDHVQMLVRASDRIREEFYPHKIMPELGDRTWNLRDHFEPLSLDTFVEGSRRYRSYFQDELMGRFDEPLLEPNPRTRKVYDRQTWTGYEVVLDVYPELFAWGILLVPKDIQEGEKRPVVVCQHGRNGLPRDVVEGDHEAYRNFAARLAERGFVVFAPHNLYRGEDRYRWLDRKANSVKATLFSFIIAQHDQITRWLASLPFVDENQIAFYGLSYGGETAVRVPAVLERYSLSICSGDFNQWTRKVAATDQPFSFMYTIEWEMPYFNLGMTFDYAEMAYLILPRPFMVERGMHDWVGRDPWVAHEYAKVRWLYTRLGIGDRTEIEYFSGGHTIHGRGTFDFLHKHLNWPERR